MSPIILLVLPCLAGLIWLWITVVRRPKVDLPTCAKCGYSTRALQSLNCPECGADLREAGIVSPAMRRSIAPITFIILWTLLLAPPVMTISFLAIALGPQRRISSTSIPTDVPVAGCSCHRPRISFGFDLFWLGARQSFTILDR